MLHLWYGTNWIENRDRVLDRIREDVAQEKGNRILLVPELVSHDMERRLCEKAGVTASRFAEVLSFTRLIRRVAEYNGCAPEDCMDNGGRLVVMAAAARQCHGQLKVYASVETKPEFLMNLIDAVDEFKRCRITPEDLTGAAEGFQGIFSEKLKELGLLYSAYDALCSRGKRDPRDQENLLLELLEEGDFAEKHTFYIDGFPDLTVQHMQIIRHLMGHARDVVVCLNCDSLNSRQLAFEKVSDTAGKLMRFARELGVPVGTERIVRENDPMEPLHRGLFQGTLKAGGMSQRLKVFRGDSPYQECAAAAERVMELVRGGARYRDVAVVCPDLAGYRPLLELAFQRCGIPLYITGTEDILRKSVIATVLSAMDAALDGFEQKTVLRYLRSVLSPVKPEICDKLENYAVVWGIRGNRWTETWRNHPDGLSAVWNTRTEKEMEFLNAVRAQAMEPLVRLRDGFRDATNISGQLLALYGFLENIRLAERLDNMARELDRAGDNRSAQILNQLWEILLNAMEQMYDALGDTNWGTEGFTRLFQLLLSQYDVGTIPPVLDTVHAGQVSAMRLYQTKHLILLGAEEGNLPGYPGAAGILTDQERVSLRDAGVTLTGGNLEGIQNEFAEIYGVFAGAEESVWVFSSSEQPSFVCRRLATMAGGFREVEPGLGPALADPYEAGALLVARGDARAAQALSLTDIYENVRAHRDYGLGKVERSHIDGLYGHTLNLSASQIDRQAECRLSYFLKYGLRARERKEATVDPAEFGTYVHDVLERTAKEVKEKGGFPAVSLEDTLEIAEKYSDAYAKEHFSALDSERVAYLFRRNSQELRMVVRELWEELRESGFQPVGFEVDFGSPEGLPAIDIPGHDMNAILRGYVDRVDTWEQGNTSYFRVVDYKTGKKDFDYCDVFNGVGLQMLLYLFALQASGAEVVGSNPVAAGVQYFPARVPYVSVDGRVTPEELEALRMKERKRKGLLLADEQVLQAMEPGEEPRRLCITRKKDGTVSGDLADREQLKLLRGYLFKVLGRLVDDIASGNVEPNPYTRGSSHSACAFCPYGTVCHEAEVTGRRNYKTMDAQRFWDEIGKEMRTDG